MSVLTLCLFTHVLGKQGAIWEGAAAAWVFAVLIDGGLVALLIYRLTEICKG
jgi:hypothetical protein